MLSTLHTHTQKVSVFLESNYIATSLKVYRFLESFKSSIAVAIFNTFYDRYKKSLHLYIKII